MGLWTVPGKKVPHFLLEIGPHFMLYYNMWS